MRYGRAYGSPVRPDAAWIVAKRPAAAPDPAHTPWVSDRGRDRQQSW